MVEVRFWHPADYPYLQQMAIQMTLGITPPDDMQASSVMTIAGAAVGNLQNVLSAPGGTAVVATMQGVPVGFLLVGIQPDERTGESIGYLADIYVAPAARGRGLARQMNDLAEQYLRSLGIQKASAWVHAHNRDGRGTASSFGLKTRAVVLSKRLTHRAG